MEGYKETRVGTQERECVRFNGEKCEVVLVSQQNLLMETMCSMLVMRRRG